MAPEEAYHRPWRTGTNHGTVRTVDLGDDDGLSGAAEFLDLGGGAMMPDAGPSGMLPVQELAPPDLSPPPLAVPPSVQVAPPAWVAPAPPAIATTTSHAAAIALLLTTGLAALGAAHFGMAGAVGGVALGGALSNTIRAVRLRGSDDPVLHEEAVWSGGTAALGFLVAGYMAWKIREK